MPLRPTKVRYTALTWLIFAAVFAYLSRNALGVAESTIRDEFGITKTNSGILMGAAFFWSYALLQIPSGLFAQHVGTRIGLGVFALVWATGAIFLGLAAAFWMLIAAQILMGLAQAGAFPAATQSISKWMPIKQRSFSCGLLASGMQVGAILAATLTGLLMTGGWGWSSFTAAALSWRWVFVIFAVPSIIWAIGFMIRFRNDPQSHNRVNVGELEIINGRRPQPSGILPGPTPWLGAIQSSALCLLCIQQFCRAAGYAFFVTWFPTFLQKTRGVEIDKSGYFQAIVVGSTLIGSLCGGALVDAIWRKTGSLKASRSRVGATCLAITCLLIFGAYFVQNLAMAIALLSCAALLAGLVGPCAYSAAIDISGRHVAPFFGTMNMIGNIGAGALPIVLGVLFDRYDNWNFVLILFAAI
ncbi:MAG: MFS transporter, partial [Verrucomicrobiota bacterium]